MGRLWRFLALLVILACIKVLFVPQSQEFISWSKGNAVILKLQGEFKQLQRYSQDLPTSIQMEVRRLWGDFRRSENGKEV